MYLLFINNDSVVLLSPLCWIHDVGGDSKRRSGGANPVGREKAAELFKWSHMSSQTVTAPTIFSQSVGLFSESTGHPTAALKIMMRSHEEYLQTFRIVKL